MLAAVAEFWLGFEAFDGFSETFANPWDFHTRLCRFPVWEASTCDEAPIFWFRFCDDV
jgi:hypothetical protein